MKEAPARKQSTGHKDERYTVQQYYEKHLHTSLISIFLPLIFMLLVSVNINGQAVDHWEIIVNTGQQVKYLVPEAPVPADWIDPSFDDAGWTDGINGVGYGDNDDNTVDTCLTVYVRSRFEITDRDAIDSLVLYMDFDDGFVAYLNGREIARDNMGEPFSPTSWDQPSVQQVEELPVGSYYYVLAAEDLDRLVNGENTLCVEVHNRSENSSDLSSNTYLIAGINTTTRDYATTPSWFVVPKTYVSRIPLMVIYTNGQEISKEAKIVADMGMIYNGYGEGNFPEDSFNIYDGKISIKIRGNTSSNFPKKPYTIELQTDSGTNNNVSLLGLPRENDFVLNGPYSDKSLFRNIICFKVFEGMGHWAPRTRFLDLYLDGDYKGVYVLMEKIKLDKYRVNDKQLDSTYTNPEDITGGYILQVDRTDGLESNEFWTSPTPPLYNKPVNTFEYYDPDIDDLTSAQATYIRNWINSFDAVMVNYNFKDPVNGYRAFIDVESFADYLLLHEFNKDVDAFRLSTFFYKASDEKGGRLHAGPPWDYNITLGNINYGDENWETDGWLYPTASRYWWRRLMDDPYFKNTIICRWNVLSKSVLNETSIHAMIDSMILQLGSSIEHNFVRWPILGTYFWPNYFVGDTYDEEIEFLKNWISGRLAWMGSQWDGQCEVTGDEDRVIPVLTSLTISPNPSDLAHVMIRVPDHVPGRYMVSIYSLQGREVHREVHEMDIWSGSIFLEDLSHLTPGMYILKISGQGRQYSGKMIRK